MFFTGYPRTQRGPEIFLTTFSGFFTRGFQGPQGGGLGFQGERGQVSFRDGAFWYAGDLQMDLLFSQWAFFYMGGFRWGFFSRLQTIRFFPIFFPALGTTGLLHAPIVCGFAALLLRTNFCLARGLFGTWGFPTGVSPPRLQTIGFFSHFLPRSWCHRCVACSDSLRICFALGCCTGVPGIEPSLWLQTRV